MIVVAENEGSFQASCLSWLIIPTWPKRKKGKGGEM
jgi:hypothetical protein